MNDSHYFIAVPVPDSIRTGLAKWQHDLSNQLPYNQWTNQGDLHITLKFFGKVDDIKLRELNEVLKKMNLGHNFYCNIDSIGFFGKKERPRILWAGVELGTELAKLQYKIEHITEQIGFQKENRPYCPHLTLAKKWNGESNANLIQQQIATYLNKQFQFLVEKVVIYKVNPTNKPKYSVKFTYQLRE